MRSLTRAALGIDIGEGNAPGAVTQRDRALRRLLMLADVVAATVALLSAVVVAGDDSLHAPSLLLLPIVVVSGRLLGLYDRDETVLSKTTLNEGPALFHLATLSTLIVYVGQGVLVDGRIGADQGLALWGAFLLASGGCRSLARHLAVKHSQPERVVVIGDEDRVLRVCEKLQHGWALNAEVVRCYAMNELPETAEARALIAALVHEHDAQRVIVASGNLDSERLLAVIRETKAHGVKVSIQPRVLDVIGSAVEFEHVHGDVFLGVRRFGLNPAELRTKRATDILLSLLMLPVVGPVIALAAIAIKLDSPGPVFFRQERIGRDGRPFQMWKLRTMVEGAEERKAGLMALNEAEGGLFKMTHDPRVTRVGRILRRTAIDELPQFLNVLAGQMSLVGPRPLIAIEDQRIAGWHRRRLHLVPGMTGMWQVLGSARIPLQDMVALDYLYIVNWSVWNDFQILLRTAAFVVRGRGM
ncbi:MAG: sugar transferase [Actinomycetota bacterium]|nr:sugar transferase [Actinomycetota bacterium]MDQ5807096.1 sugar transferase [Actinomycetota bacterium]